MSNEKHYKYDGHVTLSKSEFTKRMMEGMTPKEEKQDIIVEDVKFLVPVNVIYRHEKNGEVKTATGHIDYLRKEAFFDNFGTEMSKAVFDFLENATTLAPTAFAVDETEAQEIMAEADRQLKEQVKKEYKNG